MEEKNQNWKYKEEYKIRNKISKALYASRFSLNNLNIENENGKKAMDVTKA
jgi:hypothetical protein